MARPKKETTTETETVETKETVTPNDLGWNDYVLGLLSDDEKIEGNPTTDGLRRIFEIALDCVVISAETEVVQTPDVNNEKRATAVHTLTYVLNGVDDSSPFKHKTVSGAADVYWGNCDKIYRNHPVAVAETRAEGRALRRGLKLRKVVAAEELASNIEDNVDGDSIGKISNNQISFVDQMARRLDINVEKLLAELNFPTTINNVSHDNAVLIIRELSKYQQNLDNIPESTKGYDAGWRSP
jgi:hypothetical protein